MSAAVSSADIQTAAVNNKCASANSSVVTFDENDDDVRILPSVSPPTHCDGRIFCNRKDSADLHVDFSLNLSDADNEGNVENQLSSDVTDINKNTPDCAAAESSSCTIAGGSAKRFLTAKYPKQRMGLVRRRIAVEDWIDDELRKLHNVGTDDTYGATIDLDELLEMKSAAERSQYVKDQLSPGVISETEIDAFITELLVKVESLAC